LREKDPGDDGEDTSLERVDGGALITLAAVCGGVAGLAAVTMVLVEVEHRDDRFLIDSNLLASIKARGIMAGAIEGTVMDARMHPNPTSVASTLGSVSIPGGVIPSASEASERPGPILSGVICCCFRFHKATCSD